GGRRSVGRTGEGLGCAVARPRPRAGGGPISAEPSTASARHPATDPVDYDDAVRRYDPVICIEVHVELGTKSKMFCSAPTEFGAPPNSQVTPGSLKLPGSLPVLNHTAVESAIKIGLALNCQIAEVCRFARK